jgi:hypothetical protein
VFFFDESRFGTHSRIGHGWFKTGSRTSVKKKLGFKNFYLYTAASPINGEEFSLLAPYVNNECMSIFLQQMSEWLGNRKSFVVMDQAGWHKAKDLKIPDNINIIFLPPYSPELNPVERLWKYIKDHVLKNKIYDSLETLENSLCEFINSFTPDIIKSICNVNYMPRYL